MISADPSLMFVYGSGWLPTQLHLKLISLQGFIYIALQAKEISNVKRKLPNDYAGGLRKLYTFISEITAAELIVYIGLTVREYNSYNLNYSLEIFNISCFIITIASLMVALVTFKNYSFINGITASPITVEAPTETKTERQKAKKTIVKQDDYMKKLELAFIEKELFKIKGLTVYNLATELDLSPKALSNFINTTYQKRFNDYVNDMRIEFVINRLKQNNWREYTLEGISSEAGFSSRVTFFITFKKRFGMSPSEYVKSQSSSLSVNQVALTDLEVS